MRMINTRLFQNQISSLSLLVHCYWVD
jgi:hypothetical protein